MTAQKSWYQSKTIWTSLIGLVVAILTTFGVVDLETGAKLGGLLLPLITISLRLGEAPIGGETPVTLP